MTYPWDDRDLTPEADAAEQAAEADPGSLDETEPLPASSSIEAPEWDAQEQGRIVHMEDDYR